MDVTKYLDRANKQRLNVIKIKDYEFTYKTPNELDLTNFEIQLQNRNDLTIQTSIVIKAISNYKGIKVKDVFYEYDENEAEELLPFHQQFLEEFLGKNQDVFLELFKEIYTKFNDLLKKINAQKKT